MRKHVGRRKRCCQRPHHPEVPVPTVLLCFGGVWCCVCGSFRVGACRVRTHVSHVCLLLVRKCIEIDIHGRNRRGAPIFASPLDHSSNFRFCLEPSSFQNWKNRRVHVAACRPFAKSAARPFADSSKKVEVSAGDPWLAVLRRGTVVFWESKH